MRIDEPGINDPPVKLMMTGVNFFILYMLQTSEMLDPSETPRVQAKAGVRARASAGARVRVRVPG